MGKNESIDKSVWIHVGIQLRSSPIGKFEDKNIVDHFFHSHSVVYDLQKKDLRSEDPMGRDFILHLLVKR